MPYRLLDLFCGAGGSARGYQSMGFHVTGVDNQPQPRYAGDVFVQGDALEYLQAHGSEFDVIHASPPCQAYTDLQKQSGIAYPDYIPLTRALLEASGQPWVMENVDTAPLRNAIMLCGNMFPELRVYRHRLFEASFPLVAPPHDRHREYVFTYDKRKNHFGTPLDLTTMRVQVTGGGNAPVWAKSQAMGIDWMFGRELNEAIPPVYTWFIGFQLLTHVERDMSWRMTA